MKMSEAYASTLDISFDVRGGLLIRQIHHWAALIFIAAIVVHMFRVFFTGAFRKPREINWVIGSRAVAPRHRRGLHRLLAARRPALRHRPAHHRRASMQSIPVVGTYLSFFLFGGEFPGETIIPRLYTRPHPAASRRSWSACSPRTRAAGLRPEAHPVPRPGPHQQQRRRLPGVPVYTAKAGGFFFIVFGVIALLSPRSSRSTRSGLYGPYDPAPVTAGTQPDWYMGFADGALRLMPGCWRSRAFGLTLSLQRRCSAP